MFSTTYDKDNKVWSGKDIVPTYNPKISIAQVILSTLHMHGPGIAQVSDNNGIELSFNEIRIKTIRAAQNLQKRGYEPKQVFGLMAKNSHHVAPIVFASICIGCPINTLDPTFGKTELIYMLKTTKPALMFCDVEVYDLVAECLAELKNDAKIVTFGGSTDGADSVENLLAETNTEIEFSPTRVNGETEAAVIICSSGTTGLSKGVCLSHAALLDSTSNFDMINSADVLICFSSLYWLSGLMILLKGTLCGATRIITTDVYSPELQFRLIEHYKVTYALNSPHHLILMMKHEQLKNTDLSSLRVQLAGGSKVPLHVQIEMNSYIPNGNVCVAYGMSEIAGVASCDYPGPSGRDTIGQLINGMQMKIVDDEGNKCDANVDGEICVKTNYKFLGYFANREATDELFDDEDFLKTGDIGHFDGDGYLYIVDRKKDLLKFCGFQISPSEIEEFLLGSPGIKLVCVVGIPDDVASDLPAAVIVRADGSNITGQETYDMVAEHFADYYKLRGGVYFVDALPITPSGKVLRRKVKEIAVALYNEHNN